MSKIISNFDINIHGLEEKIYEYQFEGNDSFFESFEQEALLKGSFVSIVKLEKTANLIRLIFEIKAEIPMQCDRSLMDFSEQFNITETYIYKFGDTASIVSDEIEVIAFGETKINIAEHIFDYIVLAIPMKKLHPMYRNDVGNDEEGGVMVYVDKNAKTEKENNEMDPRWAALLDLNNLKK